VVMGMCWGGGGVGELRLDVSAVCN